ncbi:MAG: lysozyme inhibitor LprI family protein [Pseudomonadota bacterium]
MLIRSFFCFAATIIFACHTLAQSPAAIDEAETQIGEDTQREGSPYPFERELNDCIREDVLKRGIGEPCIDLVDIECPQESPRRGAQDLMSCSDYQTAYWSKRLQAAVREVLAAYDAQDAEKPSDRKRGPQLQDVQAKWSAWRDAKCRFVVIADNHTNHWRHMRGVNCRYQLTALRALELEALKRVLVPD